MNAFAIRDRQEIAGPSMKGAVIQSTIFHIVLFSLTAIGIPFVAKDPLIISTPITVEIVDIDEITQTNKTQQALPKIEEPPKPKPAPQVKAEPPRPKPEPVEAIPELKPKVKPKPKPKKPKAKPKPPEKQKDFTTLLKNLTPDLKEPAPKPPAQVARLAEKLTISELDSFKRQIEPCWNVPSGAKNAEDLVVEVRVLMNPDMTVAQASILNQGRYNRDSHFRAAADAAMRALRNPRCSPLKLPPGKYDQWKTITIRFDPREML